MYENKYLPKLAPFKIIYLFSLLFIFFIILLFWKVIIHYVYIRDLNEIKCSCARDWKQKLVQYGPIINIVISIILFLTQYIIVKKELYLNKYNIVPILFYIIYITYTYKLIKNKCECSKNWKREFILIFTVILVIIQIMGIVFTWA